MWRRFLLNSILPKPIITAFNASWICSSHLRPKISAAHRQRSRKNERDDTAAARICHVPWRGSFYAEIFLELWFWTFLGRDFALPSHGCPVPLLSRSTIIMFAVPMGIIGVIWTLWATGTTLNIESFMGIIVMVGIVVSNSILLVDFANQRQRQGEQLRRATIESAHIRMRPILMTALATVAGLMPIALKLGEGSEASAPLARAAIGGLTVSTALTLFLVPCVYELFYGWIERSPNS